MGEPSRIDSSQTVGKYTLIEKISDGYLGPVYRSFDQDSDRAVDVRILCDGIKWAADLEDLFRKECEGIFRLQHPNIASLIEVSTEGQTHFMVMEPLGTRDLNKLVGKKPELSFEAKISIMIQVAEGLGVSHKEGILHRNLCPENIFMAGDGSIKIRDFAVAHVLMRHLPHPGVRWGAPIYLSPEQIQHKACTAQSDIFALGVIFYELLTGAHPFYAEDSNKALDNILQDIHIPTFERYPDFHPRIWQILKTCLAKKPGDRYGNVDDMLVAFRGLLKDMAEDVQLMLSELQSSFASLKIAAQRPGASDTSIRLYNKVQNLLRGVDNTDYSRLDHLITELLEVYPEIRENASEQRIYDSLLHPKIQLEQVQSLKDEKSPIQDAASPAPQLKEVKDRVASPENPAVPVVDEKDEVPGEGVPTEIPLAEPNEAAVEDLAAGGGSGPHGSAEEPQMEDLPSDSYTGAGMDAPVPGYGTEKKVSGGGTVQEEFPETGKVHPLRRKLIRRKFYGILKPVYRIIAALLIILLTWIVIQYVRESGAGETLRGAFKNFVLEPLATVKESVLEQVRSGDEERASMESAEIFNDLNTIQYEAALLDELEEPFAGEYAESPAQERLDRISVMLGSGKLQQAEAELDRVRRLYPHSPQVTELYKKWQEKTSGAVEKESGEEALLETARRKEDAWNGQFMNFFMRGKYKEAGDVVGLWLGELPHSSRALESNAAVEEIRARMAAFNTAMSEGRYHEALEELSAVEEINPSDPNIADLREQVESRMTSATGTVTVHRLGDEATLLLDGEPFGNDGEIVGKRIPAGSHKISVEKDGNPVASRRQELLEGQTITLVYDLARQSIRPMIEPDQILIDRRKAVEEVYRFTSEHPHGIFRGSCSGELILSVYEVIYRPASGSHGFRIPFNLLRLEQDGKNIDMFFISDSEHFKEFEFEDQRSAAEFYQTWNKLKSLPRP